jgi:hypothetical protein
MTVSLSNSQEKWLATLCTTTRGKEPNPLLAGLPSSRRTCDPAGDHEKRVLRLNPEVLVLAVEYA